jgi:hypothetical protein
MMPNSRNSKLPVVFVAGSFLTLMLIMLFTRPVDKLGLAFLFFGALLIFLISLGHLLVRLQLGSVNGRNRSKIVIISASLVTLVMFRSAQSLGWADAVVLILISAGLVFYSARRTPYN